MSKLFTKEFWLETLERSIKTFAEVVLSMITVGQTFLDINWLNVLSVSGVAVVISIFTSIVTLPNRLDRGWLFENSKKLRAKNVLFFARRRTR